MDYTLDKIVSRRGDCKDEKDGTICIAVTEYKWFIDQVKKVEQLQKTNTKLNHEIGAYSGKVRLIADKLLNLENEMLNK